MLLEVDAFYTRADRSKYLVGNRIEYIREYRYGKVVAKDLNRVSLVAVNVGHVDHANVHTDIANVGRLLSVHQAVAMAIAQVAVQSVGIANRYGGNA